MTIENNEDLLEKRKRELLEKLEKQKQIELLFSKIEAQLKLILSKDAFNRFINIKMVNPEFALQIAQYILQLHNSGLIKGVLEDDTFKKIINKLLPKKKETKIKFIRK